MLIRRTIPANVDQKKHHSNNFSACSFPSSGETAAALRLLWRHYPQRAIVAKWDEHLRSTLEDILSREACMQHAQESFKRVLSRCSLAVAAGFLAQPLIPRRDMFLPLFWACAQVLSTT